MSAVSVKNMLEAGNYTSEGKDSTKEKVYENIVDYLVVEGYPEDDNPNFKENNMNDLVSTTIIPVIASFIRKTGRTTIQLSREKVIISEDEQTGGYEEFVVVDEITVSEEKCLLIIEAKRSSVSQATKQLMLAMKDARGGNQGGIIYGFVTTGTQWRMLKYDGKSFSKTEIMMLVF